MWVGRYARSHDEPPTIIEQSKCIDRRGSGRINCMWGSIEPFRSRGGILLICQWLMGRGGAAVAMLWMIVVVGLWEDRWDLAGVPAKGSADE
jgi:hypothetical protein